jgi:hypothetical protein
LLASSASALQFAQPGGPWPAASPDLQSIAVGDVNEDGRDDVVTVNYDPNTFSVMLAGVNGSLAAPASTSLAAIPYSVALGDLTNDGHLDVIVAANDLLMVYPGNGDGTFGTVISSPSTGYDGVAVEVGHFNAGSNLDVVVADYTSGTIGLFLGDGAGDLVPNGSTASGSQPIGITVGDFDKNGIDDLATANYGSFVAGAITVALSDAVGLFTAGPGSPLEGDYQPRDITSGDFDGDGNFDLAVVNSPNQAMTIKLGDGTGAFADAPSLPAIPSHWGESVAAADFDDDGYDDFGVTYDDSTAVFLGSETGAMTGAVGSPWNTTAPAYAWYLETGDFNGDGLPDFVNGDLSGRVSVFINAAPRLTVAPSSLAFGSQEINTGPSAGQAAEFTSSGQITVNVDEGGVSLDGANSDQFQIVSEDCDDATLDPDESCTVDVAFNPTSTGAKSATLVVDSDSSGGQTEVDLSGTGTSNPGKSVDPTSHDFGGVPVGEGQTLGGPQTFTVESSGTTTLAVLGVSVSGPDADQFEIDSDGCSDTTLPVEATCEVIVHFLPTSIGTKSASLEFSTNVSGSPQTAALSGNGEENPGFTLTPANQDFGTRTTGAGPGASQPFTLTSTGTTDLEVGTATLAGAAADQFQISSDACSNQTLVPGATCEVSVAFAPTTAGEKVANLSVVLDGGVGPATSQLTGSGQDPVPPPDPCEPVAIRKVAYFTPSVKKRSNIPGVRARIRTAGPATVRISSKVVYHLKGRQRQIKYPQRQFKVAADSVNYKVAIPKKLRGKLKPKKRVRFVITYASKAADPQCTKFGEKKTRNLTTRVVWVIPNG